MDRKDFERCVVSYQESVRRFLTALCCGDREEADDLAQDTFVKAYLSSDGFRDNSKFKSWIFRIAYNTFVSRRRSARSCDPLDSAVGLKADERSDNGFDYQALYLVLDRLSPKERTATLLFYMQGYSAGEISGIMDCSAENVRQLLSRGRQHLRKLLEETE